MGINKVVLFFFFQTQLFTEKKIIALIIKEMGQRRREIK